MHKASHYLFNLICHLTSRGGEKRRVEAKKGGRECRTNSSITDDFEYMLIILKSLHIARHGEVMSISTAEGRIIFLGV